MMKLNNFWGGLTDISAEIEALKATTSGALVVSQTQSQCAPKWAVRPQGWHQQMRAVPLTILGSRGT